jgi:hypothetical protein
MQGYDDALRDVSAWFENHGAFFKGKAHKLFSVILKRFVKHRLEFFRDKECYEFQFTPEEIKAAGVKGFPPEPPRWKTGAPLEAGCHGTCPKCGQTQFFFTREELWETENCRVCKAALLPPPKEGDK